MLCTVMFISGSRGASIKSIDFAKYFFGIFQIGDFKRLIFRQRTRSGMETQPA